MSDYIKREDAVDQFALYLIERDEDEKEGRIKEWQNTYTAEAHHVSELIPAADVVEVVRCKDCKYSIVPESKLHIYCRFWHDEVDSIHNPYYLDVDEYNYCNYGKRKEQEHEQNRD